jgi:FixJ family two-component response regulator
MDRKQPLAPSAIGSTEREVMKRVVAGLLNKQIGAELGTSESTVKIHRHQVMEKMGVPGRVGPDG